MHSALSSCVCLYVFVIFLLAILLFVSSFYFLFFLFFIILLFFFFFFFSSRRRHTRLTCDWSSDVCSSDLAESASFAARRGDEVRVDPFGCVPGQRPTRPQRFIVGVGEDAHQFQCHSVIRSEERRVGKECRSWWVPDDKNNKQEKGMRSMCS